MDHSLKGSWWEAPSLEGLFFSGWLISHCLPLDASSINTEAALFLLTKWQTSWHIYLAHFLEENPKSSLREQAHCFSRLTLCNPGTMLAWRAPSCLFSSQKGPAPFPWISAEMLTHQKDPSHTPYSRTTFISVPLTGLIFLCGTCHSADDKLIPFFIVLSTPSRKNPDAGKDWGQEKGATKDEMVGWHHRFNGHEFEQTPGDTEGQGSLACCSPWGCKEPDKIEQLNNHHPTQNVTSAEPGSLEFHLWYLGEWKSLGYSLKVWMKD